MAIADIYFKKFNERGFITFTVVDGFVKEFIRQLGEKGITAEVEQHKGFVTVTKVHKVTKREKFDDHVEYNRTHDMSFGEHTYGWKALVTLNDECVYVYGNTKAECTREARRVWNRLKQM